MTTLSRRNAVRAIAVGALATVALGTLTARETRAEVIVRVAPPPLRAEVIPELPAERRAEEYWQPGHWRWSGSEYTWTAGVYVRRPRAGAVWDAPHWERRGEGWYFHEGRWR